MIRNKHSCGLGVRAAPRWSSELLGNQFFLSPSPAHGQCERFVDNKDFSWFVFSHSNTLAIFKTTKIRFDCPAFVISRRWYSTFCTVVRVNCPRGKGQLSKSYIQFCDTLRQWSTKNQPANDNPIGNNLDQSNHYHQWHHIHSRWSVGAFGSTRGHSTRYYVYQIWS